MTSSDDREGEAEGFEPRLYPPRGAASFENADFSDTFTPDVGVSGAESLPRRGVVAESPVTRQASRVFELLRAAIEEATQAAESRNAILVAELQDLQTRALHSIQESALATIELFEALGAAQTPDDLARRQVGLAQRQGETVRERLAEFLQSACKIAAAMTFAPRRQIRSFRRFRRIAARQRRRTRCSHGSKSSPRGRNACSNCWPRACPTR